MEKHRQKDKLNYCIRLSCCTGEKKMQGEYTIRLFNKKEECCGCSACYSICPQHAISMREDEEGFEYPYIEMDVCIECHLCESVCPRKLFGE